MTDNYVVTTLLPPSTSRYQVEGFSVKEAAQALGISEKTVRNRIQAGTLPAIKATRPQGYEWRVFPAGVPTEIASVVQVVPDPRHVEGQVAPDPEEKTTELARLLEKMYADNQRLAEVNAQLSGQVGFLQAKLQDAEEQIRLLMAPQEPELVPQDAPAKRPWWRRFLG